MLLTCLIAIVLAAPVILLSAFIEDFRGIPAGWLSASLLLMAGLGAFRSAISSDNHNALDVAIGVTCVLMSVASIVFVRDFRMQHLHGWSIGLRPYGLFVLAAILCGFWLVSRRNLTSALVALVSIAALSGLMLGYGTKHGIYIYLVPVLISLVVYYTQCHARLRVSGNAVIAAADSQTEDPQHPASKACEEGV